MGVSAVETTFRFLFKFPQLMSRQGDVAWGLSRPVLRVVAGAIALAVAALLTYRRVATLDRPRDRLVLVGLRLATLAVLLVCLVRPTLILKAAVPQQNFVAVLVDDSRSMAIADRDGQPRSAFVQQQLGGPHAPLLEALSKRFVVRFFRFSSASDRMAAVGDLKYEGTATRIGQALDRARDELAGLPLAGLVVVSDGADTSEAAIDESLASLKARSIPVFTVGVGQESFARDIQVTRVETPRAVLKGTALVVDVVLSQTGYSGRTVPITVEDDGRIVSTQEVKLPADGESATVKVRFTASDTGPRLFRFRVGDQPGEQVRQNNARDALIEVRDRKEKILYFEGEPRPEMKFINRAVTDDKNLNVTILQRTAENESASAARWADMPPVTTVNSIHQVKPGATVLLTGTDSRKQDQVVLAYQRYGRGKAIAMPIQDSWFWKMDARMAVADTTHAMFWRRMIRWLVDGVPDQVNVTTTTDRVEPGEPIKLSAEVLDSSYTEVNDSRAVARVTSPSGKTSEVPVDWTVTRDGDYRATVVPDEAGVYEIKVTATRAGSGGHGGTDGQKEKDLGTAALHVRVAAGDAEYFD